MPLRDILLALSAPFCFGIGFAMAKPAISHFPPLFLMLLIYFGLALVIGSVWRGPSLTTQPTAALVALCGVTLQGWLIFYGYRELSASVATLVVQTQVPIGIVLGWLFCGEQLSWRKTAGIVIAFAGVAIIVGVPTAPPPLVPVAMVTVGGLAWALGQIVARKYASDDGIILLRSLSFHAVPQLAIATLLLETGQMESLRSASAMDWVAAASFGILGFFCGYIAWFSVLRRHPVSDVMPFMLLMPIVGVFVAVAALGDPLTATNVVGGAVIILGVATSIGVRRRLAEA